MLTSFATGRLKSNPKALAISIPPHAAPRPALDGKPANDTDLVVNILELAGCRQAVGDVIVAHPFLYFCLSTGIVGLNCKSRFTGKDTPVAISDFIHHILVAPVLASGADIDVSFNVGHWNLVQWEI